MLIRHSEFTLKKKHMKMILHTLFRHYLVYYTILYLYKLVACMHTSGD